MFASAISDLMAFTGETLTLRVDSGISRSADLTEVTRTTTDITVRGCFRNEFHRGVAGQVGEVKRTCYVEAKGLTSSPTKNDKIISSDGMTYNIMSVDARKHGNTILAYIMDVQGGANG